MVFSVGVHTSLYLYRASSFAVSTLVFSVLGFFDLGMSVPFSTGGHKASRNGNEQSSIEDKDALQLVIRHSKWDEPSSGMMC